MKAHLYSQRKLLALFAAIALMIASESPYAQTENLEFDVVSNHTTFSVDPDGPFHDDGKPAHGASFVVEGYIYPHGILDDTPGVQADGTATMPDRVLGKWICYGYFIGEGAHTKTGPSVITKQIYDFGQNWGAKMLVSEGYELADVEKPFKRAITGGTGVYADARGEITQTFMGFNEFEGVKMRFVSKLAPMN